MHFALRFFCFVLYIGFALNAFFGPVIAYLLPIFKFILTSIDSTFEVISCQLTTLGDAQVIAFDVRLAKSFWLGKHFIESDARGIAQVSTSLAHLWQSLAVCIALILSWPNLSVSKRMLSLIYGLLLCVLAWCVDVPLVLLASLWQMIYAHYGIQDFSILMYWQQMLENGGRLIMGVLVAFLVIMQA